MVLGVRAKGWLQRPELIAYDLLVKWYSEPRSTDDRIVLVGMTEDDLVKYGFPLDDEKLATLLAKLDELEPCVIGLDLFSNPPKTVQGRPRYEACPLWRTRPREARHHR